MPKIAQAILVLLLLSQTIQAARVLPVLNAPIENLRKPAGSAPLAINLDQVFGTEAIDDQVVRFTTQSSIGSLTLDFALFTNRTPGTRTNFLNYVSSGRYERSIIHRSMPGFVIQGGGFYDPVEGDGVGLYYVPTDPPIANEFGISNTLGTVSMAKLGDDPDSATSQWFVSLGNNSANLDNQNGGFTVFARITKSTLSNALDMGDRTIFPIWNFSKIFNDAFSTLPLNPTFTGSNLQETDFLLFSSVELVDIEPSDAGTSTELSYSILANTNPAVVAASISGDATLNLDFTNTTTGWTTVTVRAIDSVGNVVDDSFTVVTFNTFEGWQSTYFGAIELLNPNISGPEADLNGDGLSNLERYLHGLGRTGFQQSPVKFTDSKVADLRYPSFSFPILNTITDVIYTIEKSNDLSQPDSWTSIPFTEISRTTAGPIDHITIRADNPVSAPQEFFRLEFRQAFED